MAEFIDRPTFYSLGPDSFGPGETLQTWLHSRLIRSITPLVSDGGPTSDWDEWAWGMRTLLELEGLWKVVVGEENPEDDSLHHDMIKKYTFRSNRAALLLLSHLGEKERVRIMYQLKTSINAIPLPHARPVWNEIAKTYRLSDNIAIQTAKDECMSEIWDGRTNLVHFWGRWFTLFIIWDNAEHTAALVNEKFALKDTRVWGGRDKLKLFLEAVQRVDNRLMNHVIQAWSEEILREDMHFNPHTADVAGIAHTLWERYRLAVNGVRPARAQWPARLVNVSRQATVEEASDEENYNWWDSGSRK